MRPQGIAPTVRGLGKPIRCIVGAIPCGRPGVGPLLLLLVQVVLQLAAAAWVTQLAQSLGFDLANTFTGDVKLFANLFQGAAAAIIKAETQLEHFTLAIGQAIENIFHLLFEQLVAGCVGRRQRSVVFDKVTQVAIVLFTNGGLKADRLLADLDDLADFVRANLHLFSDLFGRGFASKVLEQTATDADQTVDRLHHVNRDTNRARLVGDRASDRLANPPGCICTKLVALRVVEFLDSTNQTDISLLDQIQQAHTTANILFCNTYHQAQVCLSQAALCFITVIDVTAIWSSLRKLGLAAFHALRQTYF